MVQPQFSFIPADSEILTSSAKDSIDGSYKNFLFRIAEFALSLWRPDYFLKRFPTIAHARIVMLPSSIKVIMN